MQDSTAFPRGFLWGASTASHQVEGGNEHNDWWQAESAGTVPHRSGSACEQFQRYDSDFLMAARQGHNAHRLSIEWSRIEPRQGEWNDAALDHYAAVIASLRSHGLEPIVTLHHFTNPAWFAARGGWERADAPALFLQYVDRVVNRLGDQVKWWLTINEPTVFVKRAYFAGTWPPHRARSPWRGWRALRSLLAAHAGAYGLIHKLAPRALVGFAHSAPWVEAHDPSRAGDRFVAATRRYVLNHLCLRLMRGVGKLPLDFIGLNYYSRELVRWEARGMSWLFGAEPPAQRDGTPRRFSSLGWEIHPEGLQGVLHEFSRYGLPLLVTENGISTSDEALRSEYLESHLQSLAAAVAAGVDVRGYCYWSLMDNFEWAEGYNARFGLSAVDFRTQQRVARPQRCAMPRSAAAMAPPWESRRAEAIQSASIRVNVAAMPSRLKRRSTFSRARCPASCSAAGSCRIPASRVSSAATSPGSYVQPPVSSSISGMPPIRDDTTGLPMAMASSAALEKVSTATDVSTNRSSAARYGRTSAVSPLMATYSATPRRRASDSIAPRSGPSPTISAPASRPRRAQRGYGAHQVHVRLLGAQLADRAQQQGGARSISRGGHRIGMEVPRVDAVVEHEVAQSRPAQAVTLLPQDLLRARAEDHAAWRRAASSGKAASAGARPRCGTRWCSPISTAPVRQG